jgi:DNA-binding response OmpR family regulator
MSGRILIVEDEEDLRFFLKNGLVRAGWQVDEAGSGEVALEILASTPCDVLLLDLRLGRMDGLAVMREVKSRWPEIMIIIMTAFASIDSAVEAVHQGAFDYLRKPCSIRDIAACAGRALVRKQELDYLGQLAQQRKPAPPAAGRPAGDTIYSGALAIEPGARTVWLAGQRVSLTPTEYTILKTLAESLGRAVPTEELIRQGLGYEPESLNAYETLQVHISNLRRKLGKGYILTARGGYVLIDLPSAY